MTNSEDLFGPKKEDGLPPQDLGKCAGCGAGCCQHIMVEIDKPKTQQDFDIIRWWLAHWNILVEVYKSRRWYLKIFTRCKYLTPDNWCWIYARRPSICRDYECNLEKKDLKTAETKFVFNSVEEIEAYAERVLANEEKPEKDSAIN